MAPNKKKKKVVSNPARGFATVSQPSKLREVTKVNEDDNTVERRGGSGNATNARSQDLSASHGQEMPDLKAMSPEELEAHFEDAELQEIVEANSARCKQDAVRQVNKLETERRQLRSQSHKLSTMHWLTNDVVEEVLQKKLEQSRMQALSVTHYNLQGLLDNSDILVKLWTLKIVLLSLDFPDIATALEHVVASAAQSKIQSTLDYIWGLQEVLEWYAVSFQEQDLVSYDHVTTAAPPVIEINGNLDEVINVDTQPTKSNSPANSTSPDLGDQQSKEAEGPELPPLDSTDSETDEPSILTDKYVQFQELLFHTESRMGKGNPNFYMYEQRKVRLQNRIEKIRRDMLFDADTADSIWQQTLQELRVDAAKSGAAKRPKTQAQQVVSKPANIPEEDEDVLGGMFGLSEDEPAPPSDPTEGTTVRLINFGKWTGTAPRRLMEESCRSTDAKCMVKFFTIANTSFSSRQKVLLKWSLPQKWDQEALSALPDEISREHTAYTLDLRMNRVAAESPLQAESYLATIVVFLLVHSGHVEHKQTNRLPTIWRELNFDLGQIRQSAVYDADKIVLKDIRKTLHDVKQKFEDDKGPDTKFQKLSDSLPILPKREIKDHTRFSTEEALAQWNSRSTSSAYLSILETRRQLPVHRYKDTVLQAIHDNQLVIVCADTGAGKSTQVPSFILEHELARGQDCHILVTQPRRISAISLARRVSQELGEHKNALGTDRSLVGYAIRLESKTSKTTRITFATTGVLLRMIEASPDLDNLDCLVLDEVHERTMDIDLLFIALMRLQQRRASLKIVLMSATVNAEKFSTYFAKAPVLNVPGRTFPVEIRYLEDAIEDTLDIQDRTGVADAYADELDQSGDEQGESKASVVDSEMYSVETRLKIGQMDERRIDYEVVASLAEVIATKEKYTCYSSAILIFMPGIAEIRRLHNAIVGRSIFAHKWVIHLLHSSFSTEDLERAFSIPPHGHRKIVIATNIAETGITIPDVTAVIDTCKEKIMRFDERRQLSKLTEGFISRSSARQRRGRAARVQKGLCFHLVTRHRFETLMLEEHVPEMLRLSLQDPILRIKVWNLGSIEDTLAAAIDPPTSKNVRRAVDKLKDAGALNNAEELTQLGKIIARLPLEVVSSKLAVLGIVFKCLDAILAITAALSSKSPFLTDRNGSQGDPRLAFARADSDLLSTLNAYQGWRKARAAGVAHQYCKKHHLSDQNLASLEDQKTQLTVYLADAGLLHLQQDEKIALSQARTSGHRRNFFHVPDRYNIHDSDSMISCVIAMAFYPKILVREGKGWRNVFSNQRVNLTSSSVNRATDKPPKWLCFYEAMQARSGLLNVLETSKIPEMVITTALGTADTRFFAGVIGIDNGRVRFSVRHWKELAAIKSLRESLASALDRCWRAPGLWMPPSDETWIAIFATLVGGRDSKAR